jgi:O-6-methylguanine DNA methyltransferase
MSEGQLVAAIAMSEKILDGELDLVELDNGSLALSDFTDQDTTPKKRSKTKSSQPTLHSFSTSSSPPPSSQPKPTIISPEEQAIKPYLSKIALSQKTVFQKRVLTALCQVPRGQYTTYALLSNHLNSSARAVGNALRNNPFAPMVPCHRVLATGGGIGGFGGKIGRGGQEGENDGEKRSLLRNEGVKFDGKGRAVGSAWDGFR